MKLHSKGIEDGKVIDDRFGFCVIHPQTHVTFGANKNPDFTWTDLPEGTRSLALICHDSDVPTVGTDVNQEGRQIPSTLPRADFTHWVVANIPADSKGIAEGEFSEGVTPRGKDAHEGPQGTLQGKNDYTGWFAGNPDMEGDYIGYDGPCPPWNDSIIHHYHFTLYALSVEKLALTAGFTRDDLLKAFGRAILAEAKITGTFTLNPELR